jgi:hypothetical protein
METLKTAGVAPDDEDTDSQFVLLVAAKVKGTAAPPGAVTSIDC